MRDLLRWLITNGFNTLIDLTFIASARLYGSAWDAWYFLHDVRNGIYEWLQLLRNFWPWSWIPGFDRIIDLAIDLMQRIFDWPLRIVEFIRNWFDENYDFDNGGWVWIVALRVTRDRLDSAVEAIGGFLDRLQADPLGTLTSLVGDVANALRSWIDAIQAQLREWTLAAIGIIVDWVNSIPGTIRDWILAVIQEVRDWVNAIQAQFREWTLATIDFLLGPIQEWIGQAKLALDWIHQVATSLQAFLDEPLEWIWARWETGLWPKVEGWLIRVWDGDA
jgi:hypothetical protein